VERVREGSWWMHEGSYIAVLGFRGIWVGPPPLLLCLSGPSRKWIWPSASILIVRKKTNELVVQW
jgi:hypothetical protein